MSDLVFHIVLFIVAGTALVMLPLLIGRLIRPNLPTPEKDAVYECGEPTIGTSYVQWDLRFYTIALLFIVFDVEVAFFFPWATLYGGAVQLADPLLNDAARFDLTDKLLNQAKHTTTNLSDAVSAEQAWLLSKLAVADILFFFGVLLVGFAYVWKRGDLEWVRASISTSSERTVPDP